MFKSWPALATTMAMVLISCGGAADIVPVTVQLTSAGGDFTFGDVTVHVPANAVTSTHQVTLAAASGAPVSLRLVGVPVTVTMAPSDSLLQPATITINYGSLTIASRIGKGTIRLHRAVAGKWVSLGGTNNTSASVVTAQTSRFSDFGLLGLRAETVQAQSVTSQSATASTAVASPPSVKVLDSAGQALEGIPVAFALTAGGGSILPASQATNASGVATATSWTAGPGAGTTNTATATAADLSAVTFNATTGGGSAGPIAWFSDFSTGVGTVLTAIRDGTKWGGQQGAGLLTQFSVVPSTGLDFPTTNVAKVSYLGIDHLNFQLISSIPATTSTYPAVGQYWFLRFYYRSEVPNGQDLGEAHWLQAHDIASWELKHTGGGPFRIVLDAGGSLNYDDNNYLVTLSLNTTYRVELVIQRLSPTTCKIFPYIFNMAGTLVFDRSTFHTFNGTGDTMALRNITGPCNDNSFLNFDFGNNDPNRTGVGSFYAGGFATRVSGNATDFIGPYTTGG